MFFLTKIFFSLWFPSPGRNLDRATYFRLDLYFPKSDLVSITISHGTKEFDQLYKALQKDLLHKSSKGSIDGPTDEIRLISKDGECLDRYWPYEDMIWSPNRSMIWQGAQEVSKLLELWKKTMFPVKYEEFLQYCTIDNASEIRWIRSTNDSEYQQDVFQRNSDEFEEIAGSIMMDTRSKNYKVGSMQDIYNLNKSNIFIDEFRIISINGNIIYRYFPLEDGVIQFTKYCKVWKKGNNTYKILEQYKQHLQ